MMSGSLPSARTARLTSLDGLRGVTALIVVFHHLALTFPAISDQYLNASAVPPMPGTASWFLISTPLHLLIAGPEGVIVFFVISGLALALPVVRSQSFDWVAYFPQRVIRLLLPVTGAVAFATVLILAVHGNPAGASSLWVSQSTFASLEWFRPILALDVLFGDPAINNPLWSLRWELVFSICLPLFVLSGVLARRRPILAMIGVWLLAMIGYFAQSLSLTYLPVFLLGVILAVRLDDLLAWAARLRPSQLNAFAAGLLLAAALLIPARWIIRGINPDAQTLATIGASFVAVGAVALVLVALIWPPARWFLSTLPMRWLGRISFSLYLVHVPIIVAVNALLDGTHLVLGAVISIAVAVAIAVVFCRFIDEPSHRLARVVGRKASAGLSRYRLGLEQQERHVGD